MLETAKIEFSDESTYECAIATLTLEHMCDTIIPVSIDRRFSSSSLRAVGPSTRCHEQFLWSYAKSSFWHRSFGPAPVIDTSGLALSVYLEELRMSLGKGPNLTASTRITFASGEALG